MTPDDLGRQQEALKRFNTPEWADFVNNFFGDPYITWHDGCDENAVLRLKNPDEKRAAEDMLISALPGGMAAARGLALLRSERAIAELEKALQATGLDSLRVRIADALEQITRSGRHVQAIIDCLRGGRDDQDRLSAAMVLGKYRTPEVIAALLAAVADHAYLVRYHACNSLLRMHGFSKDISEVDDIFVNILKDVSRVKLTLAQEQLQALFSRKKSPKKRK
jgi:hypothetical protein